METNPIKKMARNILRNRKQTLFDKYIMHPEREWFSGIFLGIIVMGLGIFWSVSTYVQFSNLSVTTESGGDEDVIYRANLVDSALLDFEERKKTYDDLKKQLYAKYESTNVIIPEAIIEEISSSTDSVGDLVVLDEEEEVSVEEIKSE